MVLLAAQGLPQDTPPPREPAPSAGEEAELARLLRQITEAYRAVEENYADAAPPEQVDRKSVV